MNNALDYIKWRGDISLSDYGPNEVDYLIFSELVYAPLENCMEESGKLDGNGPTLVSIFDKVYPVPVPQTASFVFKPRYELWTLMDDHRRFAELRLDHFRSNFEPENSKQFAAAVFSYGPKSRKTAVVAFRGTDSTVTGWKEDFDMAYKSPIPAQDDATEFLNEVIASGAYESITVCGHSKGGNLAMYSASTCSAPDSIKAVYSFDGPGLSDSILKSEGWKSIEGRIHSYIPESSVIGMLLGNTTHPVVVKSDNVSLMQHNPFYWHVLGPSFLKSVETTFSSRFVDGTIHRFLSDCTLEQTEVLVKTVFDIIEISEAVKVRDIAKGLVKRLPQVKRKISEIPEADRKILKELLHLLAGSSNKTLKLMFSDQNQRS